MGSLKTYDDYLSKIIQFNSDSTLIALRERYSMPSFFEIISKERSETTYSAFLKWLFQEKHTDSGVANPVLLFLNAVIHRSEQQKNASKIVLINDILKNRIITGKLKILNTKVIVEKPVRELAKEILNDSSLILKKGRKKQLNDLAHNCQDSIDIFMECDIESEEMSAKKLQIIIENKIDSAEGGSKKKTKVKDEKYIQAPQTTRYYIGTNRGDSNKILQLYVFLTPLPTRKLNSFNELLKKQNRDKKTKSKSNKVLREDNHFIQINYQDILNCVVQPILSSLSLSSRSRFFLEEFVNQLTFPSIEGNKVYPSIAVSSKYSSEFTKLWVKYKDLVIDAAIATSQSNFWTIGDFFYDHLPKDEILAEILRSSEKQNNTTLPDCITIPPSSKKADWEKGTRNKRIVSTAAQYGIITKIVELNLEDDIIDLLSSFWEENKRFLSALMDGIVDNERVKVKCLLNEASKRDTTKYFVYFNNQLLNEGGKPAGKGMTAHIIIKQWAELYNSKNGRYPDIDTLRLKFPKEIHAYYKNGTWFQNLFYLFKNENGVYYYFNDDDSPFEWEEATDWKWDFDPKGRFYIPTSENGDVILLKMWRKDNLEELIKRAKDLFHGKLIIEEAFT